MMVQVDRRQYAAVTDSVPDHPDRIRSTHRTLKDETGEKFTSPLFIEQWVFTPEGYLVAHADSHNQRWVSLTILQSLAEVNHATE